MGASDGENTSAAPHSPGNAQSLTRKTRIIAGTVAVINLLAAFIEGTIAAIIGSASLFADAADFMEDFLINALVVLAIGWPVASRRKASYGLAGLILIPALAAFGMVVWKLITHQPPEPIALSATGVFAMVVNVVCALMLMSLRKQGTALARGAWLAARNDVLANVLIIAAGLVTLVWYTIWPDVIVGLIVTVVNLGAAKEVFEQARAEVPELEIDDD